MLLFHYPTPVMYSIVLNNGQVFMHDMSISAAKGMRLNAVV